jgi:hypothetical protein
MEYLAEIVWLSLWPIVIFLGWKLSVKNAMKFEEKIQ